MNNHKPEIIAQLREQIEQARDAKTSLRIRGGGTKDFYGGPLMGEVIDMTCCNGVIDYDPGELVLTARAGTRLADLRTLLEQHNQQLPFDPPSFGLGATLGGAVASGLCGPKRMMYGPVRDHVLGVTVLDGRGRVLRFGGRVIKNVAGYDISRVMAGALGTLGILLDITVRLVPLPAAQQTLRFELTERAAIKKINRLQGQPGPWGASVWNDGHLHLQLAGADAAVRKAASQLGGQPLADSDAADMWNDLREQQSLYFIEKPASTVLWRVAVPSTSPSLDLRGRQLIEWGGGQRWLYGESIQDTVRVRATQLGGHATIFRGGNRSEEIFTPLHPKLFSIQKSLKEVFDPHRIFNPSRLYSGI